MSFFNKKEEVIDIQLTRFGKRSFAIGEFKPFYYQFFDDDILYNAEFAGVNESQNETQDRILEKTPRLKKNVNVTHVENEFLVEGFDITQPGLETSTEAVSKKFFSLSDQERILLYPLSSYEVDSEQAPYIEVNSHGQNLDENVKNFQHFTSMGIYKRIPQLEINNLYTLKRIPGQETTREELDRRNNANNSIDLTSDNITFLDNSKLKVDGNKIILSFEEGNSYYNMSNFELEIYEIDDSGVPEGSEDQGPILRKIKNIDDINSFFRIKTDEDVQDVQTKFGKQRNWYRSGE